MPSDVTPDGIRSATFRTTFRGLDPAAVSSLLEDAARRIESLEEDHRKLKAQLVEASRPDLEEEFDSVGREVSMILQSAREAAESMRERASLDSERWRSEAREETATARREAESDAEALRRDAWVVGSELLEQAQSVAEEMRADAERDVLTVMGAAERDAHRLTSGARREAEDLMRGAGMEAERILNAATTRRDEIVDGANRQAAKAQERTRALETRREELLEELENVRSTLARFEGSLEERREALETVAPEQTSVKVVHPSAEAKAQWELGETVRVVRTDGEGEPEVSADDLREEVARLQDPSRTTAELERDDTPGSEADAAPSPPEPAPREEAAAPVTEVVGSAPEPEPDAEPEDPVESVADSPEPPPDVGQSVEPTEQAEVVSAPEPEDSAADSEAADDPEPEESDVDSLFAALRGSPEIASPAQQASDEETTEPEPPESETGMASAGDGTDWIAVRDAQLLPITNRALRGVKKAMTELQNLVLDGLRSDGDLQLEPAAIAEAVHADLLAVWSESFAAGHAVAEQMSDDKLTRPPTPGLEEDERFGEDVAAAVGRAIEQVGEGPREQQSAVSRVFRVWRSDEAERRLRDIAILGYETGVEMSREG